MLETQQDFIEMVSGKDGSVVARGASLVSVMPATRRIFSE